MENYVYENYVHETVIGVHVDSWSSLFDQHKGSTRTKNLSIMVHVKART